MIISKEKEFSHIYTKYISFPYTEFVFKLYLICVCFN